MNYQNRTPRINRMVREIELTVQPQTLTSPRAATESAPLGRNGRSAASRRPQQGKGAAAISKLLDRVTLVATVLAAFVALCLLASSLAVTPHRHTAQLLALPIATAHAGVAPRADASVPSASSVFSGNETTPQASAPTF
jgi:hypothetical protein